MGKLIYARAGTEEDLRRLGNCFVWTGRAAQEAFGKRPNPAPEKATADTAKPVSAPEKETPDTHG